MRSPSYRSAWSVTSILLVLNLVIFLLQQVCKFYIPAADAKILPFLALSKDGLMHGYVWQLLTFQFLHAGFFHFLFNCLAIYFFGREVESTIGSKSFVRLYLLAGVAGGLLQVLFGFLIPSHFGQSVVGASAGGYGLIAAFATLFPDRQLTLLLFYFIPVHLKARVLLWISIGFALFGIVFPDKSSIAHAAHLGGILFGVLYIIYSVQGRGWRISLPQRSQPAPRPIPEPVSQGNKARANWRRPKAPLPEELPSAEFISREVDPILDKISAHGIHSLTERERQILEAARSKMAKR